MIISHKYKFIFIKTRKTAGTTIEYNISKYLGKNDIIPPSNQSVYLSQNFIYDTKISKFLKKVKLNKISRIFENKFSEHEHAFDLKKKLIEIFLIAISNSALKENLQINVFLTISCEKIHLPQQL